MTSKEIRQQFLDFFASKEHTIVDSAPVVPLDDPTLMFTNAGMNQFKDVFLGTGSRTYTRAADTQKCIRAGGKHNDLDDVGQDTYHHTFFEMLGNWSFGDYFKEEAIRWAWELLTEVWGIDETRLHATYFRGDEAEGLEPDSEAAELWKTVTDIDPTHVHPGSKKDNFWEMGETGPCGPCSEIHIDLTPDKSGASLVNAGDARVIELWNLVFIQFNRDAAGKLSPLPAKHVDTGMGFERLCAVLNGRESNYDTDVWTPVFEAIHQRTGAPPYRGTLPTDDPSRKDPSRDRQGPDNPSRDREGADNPSRDREGADNPSRDREGAVLSEPRAPARADSQSSDEPTPPSPPLARGGAMARGADVTNGAVTHAQVMIDVSYRVIADHIRCLTFALTDGAMPSNEGRGYVLRRILRRGVRYGRQYINMHEPFLCDLVEPMVRHMEDAFPELRTGPDRQHPRDNVAYVAEIIRDEEASFGATLDRGIKLFEEAADYARRHHHGKISGEDAFRLHDTYGFPIDLTELMAEEQDLSIDFGEYERLMEQARERARLAGKADWAGEDSLDVLIEQWRSSAAAAPGRGASPDEPPAPAFDDSPKYAGVLCDAHIVAWGKGDALHKDGELPVGERVAVLTDRTCFYAEQGGQAGDCGEIRTESGTFTVQNTLLRSDAPVHYGFVSSGKIRVDQQATLNVNRATRTPTMKNHTATHMLNWALREVLGGHIQQKGSLVDPEKTRFDFSHNKPLSGEEVMRIEQLVNARIEADQPVNAKEVEQKKALEINTLRAVFGEKYPDVVRVIAIGADIDEMVADPKNPKWMQYPVEFCGGTHLKRSSEAERFALISEEAVAKGIRRVVGITGEAARRAEAAGDQLLAEAKALNAPNVGRAMPDTGPHVGQSPAYDSSRPLHRSTQRVGGVKDKGADPNEPRASARADAQSPDEPTPPNPPLARGGAVGSGASTPESLADKLATFQQKVNEATIPLRMRNELRDLIANLQKKAKKQEKRAASESGAAVMDRVTALLESAETVSGVAIVVGEVPSAAPDALRSAIDWVRNKTEASAVFLAAVSDERVTLVAGMSKDAVSKGLKAGNLIKEIAPLVGGKGGGRPDMAQGGGSDPSALPTALDRAKTWIGEALS